MQLEFNILTLFYNYVITKVSRYQRPISHLICSFSTSLSLVFDTLSLLFLVTSSSVFFLSSFWSVAPSSSDLLYLLFCLLFFALFVLIQFHPHLLPPTRPAFFLSVFFFLSFSLHAFCVINFHVSSCFFSPSFSFTLPFFPLAVPSLSFSMHFFSIEFLSFVIFHLICYCITVFPPSSFINLFHLIALLLLFVRFFIVLLAPIYRSVLLPFFINLLQCCHSYFYNYESFYNSSTIPSSAFLPLNPLNMVVFLCSFFFLAKIKRFC